MSVHSRSRSRSCSVSTERSTDSCGTSATTASSVVDVGEYCLRGGRKVCIRDRELYTLPWEYTASSTTSSTTPSTRASSISSPSTSDSKPTFAPSLTVGVELEFLLLTPAPTAPAHLYPHLQHALTPLATLLSTTASPLPHPHPETIFQLKTDDTISTHPWGLQRAAPIEITTPILRGKDWEWVLPALCTAVTSLPGITARVNRSTGLHVHVGIDGRPYTLRELKRVAKAVVLLERCMDGHHPRHRIPSDALGSCYRSVVGGLVFRGCLPREMVAVVERCGSVEELLGVVNAVAGRGGGGRGSGGWCRLYKYNFTAVVGYGSVEFRQAAGTVRGGRRFRERGEREKKKKKKKKKKGGRVPMRFRLSRRRKSVYLARQGRGG